MATDSFLNRESRPHFRQHPPPLPHRHRRRKLRLEHRPRVRTHASACGRIIAKPLDRIRHMPLRGERIGRAPRRRAAIINGTELIITSNFSCRTKPLSGIL